MAMNPVRRNTAALILGAVILLALLIFLRPPRVKIPASGTGQALLRLENSLGATVEPVDRATVRTLGLSSANGDLVVTSVANQGPAADAGIRVGDVIERIGGQPASQANAPPRSSATPILINRRGKRAIVSVDLAGRSPG
jgi:predicted metalloprotease with PDZ domain